jgi:hypothetical protein
MAATAMADIEAVLHKHEDELMALPDVVAVGEGRRGGEPVLEVHVRVMSPEAEAAIPKRVEGFDVQVVESGDIAAQ